MDNDGDGWMDRHTDVQMDLWTTNGQTYKWVYMQATRQSEDGWMDGWMDGYIYIHMYIVRYV